MAQEKQKVASKASKRTQHPNSQDTILVEKVADGKTRLTYKKYSLTDTSLGVRKHSGQGAVNELFHQLENTRIYDAGTRYIELALAALAGVPKKERAAAVKAASQIAVTSESLTWPRLLDFAWSVRQRIIEHQDFLNRAANGRWGKPGDRVTISQMFRAVFDRGQATAAQVADAFGLKEQEVKELFDAFCEDLGLELDKHLFHSHSHPGSYELTYSGLEYLLRNDWRLLRQSTEAAQRGHGKPTVNLAVQRIMDDYAAIERVREIANRQKRKRSPAAR